MKKRKSRSRYPWYHKFIISRVRQVFGWSVAKREALARANGRCELCERKSDVLHADHITPCVPTTGWDGYDRLIVRSLEVTKEGLQGLCKECHQTKTNTERKERKKNEAAKEKVKND